MYYTISVGDIMRMIYEELAKYRGLSVEQAYNQRCLDAYAQGVYDAKSGASSNGIYSNDHYVQWHYEVGYQSKGTYTQPPLRVIK